eukprot:TRINITY_DN26555_c0_g1_i1.p1 TRINITY_DN26555_c0_g1~~TRINITY_DN26555_c0_g1_i1.p1  ORF type:complete len:705 (-),score=244.68 TRINITY_DN26555_c0_g1_i1:270-2348(-)
MATCNCDNSAPMHRMAKRKPILIVEDLHVNIGDKEYLKGVNLVIREGETHVLLGPNGAGKSTFLNTIMGLAPYEVTKGRIIFKGTDITKMDISERANLGVGLMFQKPANVPGLKLNKFIKAAFQKKHKTHKFDEIVESHAVTTNMKKFLDAERDLNVGFSGGELKRAEIFQLLCQQPEFCMLDEPESGVDLENINLLGSAIGKLLNHQKRACLVITHTGHILDHMPQGTAHILVDGKLRCHGDPKKYLHLIGSEGYEKCIQCAVSNNVDSSTTDKADVEGALSEWETPQIEYDDAPCVCKKIVKLDLSDDFQDEVEAEFDIAEKEDGQVMVNGDEEEEELPPCGQYVQLDQTLKHVSYEKDGIEVMVLSEAIKKYPFIKEKYLWKTVSPEKDDVTKAVFEYEKDNVPLGYVIIAHPGAVVDNAVDAQLLMHQEETQYVHNLVIAMPGSKLNVASACRTLHKSDAPLTEVPESKHLGISEFFVEKDAQLTFVMVHQFCNKYTIYPRSAAHVEEGAVFMSNYICMEAVDKVQMYPVAYLKGKGAVARFNNVVLAKPGSHIDLGSRAFLDHAECRCEMVSRIISTGGKVIARGHMIGNSDQSKGHLECQGIILEKGSIHAIPEIEANADGAELSHEAAVGKIAEEKIAYLMARGLTEDEAVATIIRGFLDIRVPGLSKELQEQMSEVIEAAADGF